MHARSVPLDVDVDPLQVGFGTAMLWKRDRRVIAGIGEAMRVPVTRPHGFAEAQRRLRAIPVDDNVGLAGSGVCAFAALPFDRHASGECVIPEITVVADPNGHRFVTLCADDVSDQAMARAHSRIVAAADEIAVDDPESYNLVSAVSPASWRDDVVAAARDKIRAGALSKVVLARELRIETDLALNPGSVLRRLHQSYGTACLFGVEGFVGASPELLVSRIGDAVHAHPLAGTAPRGSDPELDAALAQGLAASTKNQHEHRITIEWLLDSLLPFCSFVDAEPEPAIISLANVHHLGTRVEGLLSRPAASVLELVAALHPTPAVGGNPQPDALELIGSLEPGDRGLYAGPTGWVDAEGNGEFAVAIRSGTISGRNASLWAGVGVVADSDPAAELAETRSKFQAMLSAVVRP